jgi:hypothetical protein
MNEVDVLRAAKALMDTPEKWWRGPKIGHPTRGTCPVLAIDAASNDRGLAPKETFARAVGLDHVWPTDSIAKWNDDPKRTHAEVMEAFDRAIERAAVERRESGMESPQSGSIRKVSAEGSQE